MPVYETPPPPIPIEKDTPKPPPKQEATPPTNKLYDDEMVASDNYYQEKEDECNLPEKTKQNAQAEGATAREGTQERPHPKEDVHAPRVRNPIATDPDGYYLAVKEEIDKLFKTYPRDKTLSGAFSCGEWVRVKGTAKQPQYLVGILRMDGKVRYICYALATEDKRNPPDEIKNVCAFVPSNVYDSEKGFFVIFQSATTGECIRPETV